MELKKVEQFNIKGNKIDLWTLNLISAGYSSGRKESADNKRYALKWCAMGQLPGTLAAKTSISLIRVSRFNSHAASHKGRLGEHQWGLKYLNPVTYFGDLDWGPGSQSTVCCSQFRHLGNNSVGRWALYASLKRYA